MAMKKYLSILLILIGIVMIVLSFNSRILPPGLTGVGFIAIAVVFLKE
jgi:hypothetical protein